MREALAAALLVVLLASGCGGGDDEQPAGKGTRSPGVVEAIDNAFEPAETTIKVGSLVEWTNTGEQIHTVKQLPDSRERFFSKALEPGASFDHRFDRPAAYPYFCTLHPDQMKGTIKVTSG